MLEFELLRVFGTKASLFLILISRSSQTGSRNKNTRRLKIMYEKFTRLSRCLSTPGAVDLNKQHIWKQFAHRRLWGSSPGAEPVRACASGRSLIDGNSQLSNPPCVLKSSVRNHNKTIMLRRLGARRTDGVDKNIWVEITKLTAEHKTVNIGQGYPDFSPPQFLQDAFCKALCAGPQMHQYTRAFGHPRLVKSLAKIFSRVVGHEIDPFEDVLVTIGAYQALFCAFQALVDEGDEVIIIEPFFDCYQPMVMMTGGKAVYVPLRQRVKDNTVQSSADWILSAEELDSKITPRTKAIVINTPNNPLGKVYKTEELQMIADLCIKHDMVCISDEVYEWLTYDGAKHVKIASLPGMWERTITIGSAGKTFSATGWKVGWAIGSERILKHLKTIHQNSVYHCATAAQEAVAQGFEREYELFGTSESYFQQLPAMLHHKRKKLALCLESIGLQPIMPEGSYFITVDISSVKVDLNDESTKDEPYDFRFVKWLIKERGLSAIPVSAFYSPEHSREFDKYIRFCFVKEDSTLDAAENILKNWSQKD